MVTFQCRIQILMDAKALNRSKLNWESVRKGEDPGIVQNSAAKKSREHHQARRLLNNYVLRG